MTPGESSLTDAGLERAGTRRDDAVHRSSASVGQLTRPTTIKRAERMATEERLPAGFPKNGHRSAGRCRWGALASALRLGSTPSSSPAAPYRHRGAISVLAHRFDRRLCICPSRRDAGRSSAPLGRARRLTSCVEPERGRPPTDFIGRPDDLGRKRRSHAQPPPATSTAAKRR